MITINKRTVKAAVLLISILTALALGGCVKKYSRSDIRSYAQKLTGRSNFPQADAIIMQYTGYDYVSRYDAPVYVCVGDRDGIAWWRTMQERLKRLSSLGIPTEFHVYPGLTHGFGLGNGTVAEGWIDDAVRFWEKQMKH